MLTRLRNIISTPYSLADIEGFPLEEFQKQQVLYEENMSWFNGDALDQTVRDVTGNEVEYYPMRANPIRTMVFQHAKVLFGEVEDSSRPLVYPKFLPKDEEEEAATALCEEVILKIWEESNGRAAMIENAILSEIKGGCVFRISYVPWETWRVYPIRIDAVDPAEFYGVPYASDKFRLQEAWVVKEITEIEALEYGYTGSSDETYFYVEHWTAERYEIRINGKIASRAMPGTNERVPLAGLNPNHFVPFMYIPHLRAGDFWGISSIPDLVGIVKEYNLRMGDLGDAVNDDAHSYVYYRNVQGQVRVVDLGGLKAFDLGANPGLTGNEPQPDMGALNSQKASNVMKQFADDIFQEFENESYMPAIAWGKDEGSQRSGLTLAMRFWPLTSHVGMIRFYWDTALVILSRMIITMLGNKNLHGIKPQMTRLRIKMHWYPHLPRDREADVQEWVQRSQQMLGAPDTLLELTGDIDNIKVEKERILEWQRELAQIQGAVQLKIAQQQARAAQANLEQKEQKEQKDDAGETGHP